MRSIDFLLRYGDNANARDWAQVTPLVGMFSAPKVVPNCVKQLLDGGAMINAQDFQGATAFFFGAQYGHVQGLEILLRHGAKIDLPSFDRETAMTVAVQSNSHHAISFLLAHGASLRQYTVSGRSLLHVAAEYSDQETLRLLTSARIRGVEIRHKDLAKITARNLARQRSDVTSEWRATFADLIGSVDVDKLEPPPVHSKVLLPKLSIPGMHVSNMVRAVEDIIWEGAGWFFWTTSHLPRRQSRLLFALLSACLALLLYIVTPSELIGSIVIRIQG